MGLGGGPYSLIVSLRFLVLGGGCCCVLWSVIGLSWSVVRSRYMELKHSSSVSSVLRLARR